MGEARYAHIILIAIPDGNRPFGIFSRRWEDSIKMNLKQWGLALKDVDRINLAQDKVQCLVLVNTLIKLQVS
jgi:hypothetical protein